MKSILFQISSTILFLFLTLTTEAQQYDCAGSAGQSYLVTAGSGLSMREMPNLKSIKVMAVPYGKEVVVCPEYPGEVEVIEGIEGRWLKTYYRGKSGFMFSGFMQEQASIDVILPDEQIVEHYELSRQYYGLYLNEQDASLGDQKFQIKACDFKVETVSLPDVPTYEYAQLQEGDQPEFLISGLEPGVQENIIGQSFKDKFLYPGESVSLTLGAAHFHIYAKGRIVENTDGEDINPIAMIKNYELHVRRTTHDGDREDQIIYKMDIPGWYADGYEGGIFLHWIGDIDADGELDVLLSNSATYTCKEIVFFLSSKAERGHFFKQVAKYQECDGC